MKIGTKSLLYGAHCWFLHPWFVALAWWKLYGFPCDPRLWIIFFVHDLGYWGKPNMDGVEGEEHPQFGADVTRWLRFNFWGGCQWYEATYSWGHFAYYHSRFLAKRDSMPYSLFCVADKLAICLEPWWLYLPRVSLTGEIKEYMALAARGKYAKMNLNHQSKRKWFSDMRRYLTAWVAEHQDGKEDQWTPVQGQRKAATDSGVWK